MNKERLLKLAELLEADAAKPDGIKFDLDVWAIPAEVLNAPFKRPHFKSSIIPLDCGTTACAVGLAAISGVFKDEGLAYTLDNGDLLPTFGHKVGFCAAEAFFELTFDQGNNLFSSEGYTGSTRGAKGELKVAAKIREFVANG